jgi:hypothetical protein
MGARPKRTPGARQRHGGEAKQYPHTDPGEAKPQERPSARQDQALGDELAYQAGTSGPESHAHGDFPSPDL